jgi:4'-phosphopantetheinyl transferase EntD
LVTPAGLGRALAAAGGVRGLLSPAEWAVFDTLALPRRRRDWLAGRLAAKRAVRAAARVAGGAAPPWQTIAILNAPNGAPYVAVDGRPEFGEKWNISIAHDDGFAACAIARTAHAGYVGVDIERDRPLAPEMLRYALTAGERERLHSAALADAPAPLSIWMVKEAVVKAGRGEVCDAMRHVELSWGRRGALTARVVEGGWRARAAKLHVACAPWGAHLLAWATCRTPEAA